MHTKLKVLLAAGTVALACAGTGSAATPPGADYPWVQLPTWVGTDASGVFTTAPQAGVQPSAWIPPAELTQMPAIASSTYPWVQPPLWVGTSGVRTQSVTVSYDWVQPPAWIPIQ